MIFEKLVFALNSKLLKVSTKHIKPKDSAYLKPQTDLYVLLEFSVLLGVIEKTGFRKLQNAQPWYKALMCGRLLLRQPDLSRVIQQDS